MTSTVSIVGKKMEKTKQINSQNSGEETVKKEK